MRVVVPDDEEPMGRWLNRNWKPGLGMEHTLLVSGLAPWYWGGGARNEEAENKNKVLLQKSI